MNLDLSRALDEIADGAAAHADLGPVEQILGRRRRRRALRRTAAGASTLAVAGALVLAGVTLADWRVDDPQPAITGPAPSPDPTADPTGTLLPGCGDPLPTPDPAATQVLTVTGATRDDASGAVTVSLLLSGAAVPDATALRAADVRVYLPDGSHVLEVADLTAGGWTDTADGPVLDAAATTEGCEGIEPLGSTLVAVVQTAEGLVVSAPAAFEATPVDTAPIDTAPPLQDPYVSRWDGARSITSDAPASGDTLEDGDFFGSLQAVDPVARTVTVDLAVFHGGAAATDWVRVHDPEWFAAQPEGPANGYVVVDDVQRSRTLPLAPDAVITGYCHPDGTVSQRARSLADLARGADAECPDASHVTDGHSPSQYWIDVRGGMVVQLVGQYLP